MKSGNKKQKGQFVGKHKDKSEYQLEKAAEDMEKHHKKHEGRFRLSFHIQNALKGKLL